MQGKFLILYIIGKAQLGRSRGSKKFGRGEKWNEEDKRWRKLEMMEKIR